MITGWSYTKLDAYESCPRRYLHDYVQHLCPVCFKGQVEGWDEEAKCNKCGVQIKTPEPLKRGNELHKLAENAILGRGKITKAISGVKKTIQRLQKLVPKGQVRVEFPFVMKKGWIPAEKYEKGAWFRGRGDVLVIPGPEAEVIDWKSGGVDRQKQIRVGPKYDDQLELYGLCVLTHFQAIEKVKPSLHFFDANPAFNVREGDVVCRGDLPALKKRWEQKVRPLFTDKTCAPLPSNKCFFCPFEKGKGGPCPY